MDPLGDKYVLTVWLLREASHFAESSSDCLDGGRSIAFEESAESLIAALLKFILRREGGGLW